jgi:hypothetical protein
MIEVSILDILVMAKRVLGDGGVNAYLLVARGALFCKGLLMTNVGPHEDLCSFAFLILIFLFLPLKKHVWDL